MNNSNLIILTFVVTALWDVTLRSMALNPDRVPAFIKDAMPFIGDLEPYFKMHTLLAAALIAGFVGATTQPIILAITPFPATLANAGHLLAFLMVSFIVSALYGFVMKWTGLFPHLQTYYYDKLGVARSMYHDGISGLIVQATLLLLLFTYKQGTAAIRKVATHAGQSK